MILTGTVGLYPGAADKENLVIDDDTRVSTFEKVDERFMSDPDAVT